MRKNTLATFLFLICFSSIFAQQPQKPTASEIYHDLQKLNFLGSALYIAAHLDDENTRLISYLSNELHARTAYLSITCGDGGQQFFTRANDFGYSKHPEETLEIWNKKEVLDDVVLTIRRFKPDIIINRFDYKNPENTHRHHTSSAMLSVEAYDLVGDPDKYPNTSDSYGTWKPKRLFFNTS